ncbi:MAG TPA: nucleotidyltransferase family protein [Steroidobacteraceae bacterium]|nr:nucleotidyltransferase family protein [Steroidobacteraceae bacterium]
MTEMDQRWQRAILPATASIRDAIHTLNEVAIRIVLISGPDGQLEGTVSDGDLRRGLLRGLTLASPVTEVVQRSPLVVPEGMGRELILQLMTANKIQQIPVVDTAGRLVGLHVWDDIAAVADRPNLVVIMAGGMGTRLRPHTERCPKPMLPVAGKPMLEHIIERARLQGFSRFVLAIHYLGHMIESYFGDGSQYGVRIDYLREQTPLGTAGALSLLTPSPELPFVVTNGDVITDIRFSELLDFHERHSAAATMAVHLYEWQHPFGVVQMDGVEIVGFEEKPIARSHINAGVYALSPQVLSGLPTAEHCDMPTLFERLQHRGQRTVAYPMHEPWLDVGRPDDLARAAQELEATEQKRK